MYIHDRRVTYSEISMRGYADIAQIAEYFQDCSVFQSEVLGMGFEYLTEHHLAWLLASWQIDVDTYPEMGSQIRVSTWPYKFDAAFGYRNFMLQDENGKRIAVANSQWILVDTESGRVVRITPEIASHYPMEEKADMTCAPRKIAFKEEKKEQKPICVPKAFIDTNQHMNNAQYIRTALEYVPETFHIRQVRVEYKKAAVLHDQLHPFVYMDEQIIKILLGDQEAHPYAVVEFKNQI